MLYQFFYWTEIARPLPTDNTLLILAMMIGVTERVFALPPVKLHTQLTAQDEPDEDNPDM